MSLIDSYRLLVVQIIRLAMEDYRDLIKNGVTSVGNIHKGGYSIKEIEYFFKSGYCNDLLLMFFDCDVCGEDILGQLHAEQNK